MFQDEAKGGMFQRRASLNRRQDDLENGLSAEDPHDFTCREDADN